MNDNYGRKEKRYEQATTHKLYDFPLKTYVFGNQAG